ncbi:hypothetical protein C9374_000185 [Naegleria lovaniensis]|uniref:Uncharacterized protein n=1 Tax=Naegleria lovaniensis TaxID=51637 RepID=A0AA88GZA4_NAELO|nr:uncharacterized protein C9374_000185 [Naegleria lovaniensis]KAG2388746.1 hypothetical protein C9374_000185 [Naegleria lovaniensis]
MCKTYLQEMKSIPDDMRGAIVASFFSKPGYGKSYLINGLSDGMNRTSHSQPLPSKKQYGAGLTRTTIDVQPDSKYKLVKVMCSIDEYHLRCQVNNVKEEQYKPDQMMVELDTEDNLILSNNPQVRYKELCQRAYETLEDFEKNKTKEEAMMVKKLVLSWPSPFLQESKVVLRDMAGYDDREEYKQYIKESMMDVGVLFVGCENNRGTWDDGLVKKLWDHGLYSPYQNFYPSVVFLINDPHMTVEDYNKWNYNDATNKIKFGIQLSILLGVDIGVSQEVFLGRANHEGLLETSRITDLLSDCGIINALSLDEIKGIVDESQTGMFSYHDFNRLLKRLNDNQSNVEVDQRYEFAKHLFDNFTTIVVPPKEAPVQKFLRDFRMVMERARTKMYEYQRMRLRDRAFVILTYLDAKYGKSETPAKVEKRMKEKVKSITNILSKHLTQRLSNSQSQYPQRESISDTTSSSFINDVLEFYKQHIRHCFDEDEVISIIELQGNRLRKKNYKKEWNKVKPFLINKVTMIIESLTQNAMQLLNRLKLQLDQNAIGIDLELVKDRDNFINEVISLLNPHSKESSDNQLALNIYNAIVDYDDQLRSCTEDTLSLLDTSLEMSRQPEVQKLLQEYQYKLKHHDTESVTIDTKYPVPYRDADKGLFFPTMESENTDELKDKKYCAPNDNLLKYSLPKLPKSSIVVEKEKHEHIRPHNEIWLYKKSNTRLGISYSSRFQQFANQFQKITENSITQKLNRIHAIFIITRPRGKNYVPSLLLDAKKLLQSNNVLHMFIIATEACYLKRYQEIIARHDQSLIGDYYFLVLNSENKLGYATVETCVFETASHLKLEVISITHDDIDRGYEYFFDKKIIMDHEWALLRYFCFAEKTLYSEAFSSKNKTVVKTALKSVLQPNNIDDMISELLNKESNYQQLIPIQKYFYSVVSENQVNAGNAIEEISNNPQELIERLEYVSQKYNTPIATSIRDKISKIFEQKRHVGRTSLWNYQPGSNTTQKLHDLMKPTHKTSNATSTINTYYMPSMKGIHSISDDHFWKPFNDKDRKELLEKAGNKKLSTFDIDAMRKGWKNTDISLKSQMLMHGVGSFQIFCFAFTSRNSPSLVNMKDIRRGDQFDSDDEYDENCETENEEEEVEFIPPTKSEQGNTTDSSSDEEGDASDIASYSQESPNEKKRKKYSKQYNVSSQKKTKQQ